MAGAGDLVAALTGGKALEQEAYNEAATRIMAARNAQAAMDKKVQEAALLKDQMRSRGNFERNSLDLPPEARFAMLAGMGSDFNQGQQGIGHGLKNEATAEALRKALAGGDVDAMNRLIGVSSGKLLGPSNVKVDTQADADIAQTVMETFAQSALADERRAGAEKDRAGIATDTAGNVIPDLETLPTALSNLLYLPPSEIPVTVGDKWFDGIPKTTKNLPLSDPLAAKQWESMTGDERANMMQDLAPEFLSWRTANIMTDPSLQDVDIAVGKFLESKGIKQTGRAEQEKRNNRTVYVYNPTTGKVEPKQ